MRRALGLLPCIVLGACGDDAMPDPPADDAVRCSPAELESDAQDTPLAGPAVDPATGKLRELDPLGKMVSTTYLALQPDAAAQAAFQALMAPIQAQLPTQDGLLAWQFKLSARCGTARTFALWESEEKMFAFVASPAHVAAMRDQPRITRDASRTVAFEARTAADLTWARALRELEAEPEPR